MFEKRKKLLKGETSNYDLLAINFHDVLYEFDRQ